MNIKFSCIPLKMPVQFFCMSTVMSDRNLSGLSGTTRKDPSTTGKHREVATADLLFVCLGIKVPLENFSLIWRRHHCGEGLQMLTFALLS